MELGQPGGVLATDPVIMWFRRDLRLADQPALTAAVERARCGAGSVVPLFVLDPRLGSVSGVNRLAFLYRALRSLRSDGVPLVVRLGEPECELPALAAELGASHVYATADFGVLGRDRDRRVGDALHGLGVAFETVESNYVVPPGMVRKGDDTPFKVFTPFKRVWETLADGIRPTAPIDPHLVPWWRDTVSEEIPADPVGASAHLPDASEAAAQQRLRRFLAGPVDDYADARNIPGADATSRLSADLKYGLVHPRQIMPGLRGRGPGADVFRSELCWREFYADVLWHRPETARRALVTEMEEIRVDEGPAADDRFDAWRLGRTGYPFIDAGMRQLLREGWMHNRTRMAAASFLVKDLHLDWRRGARWFMDQLVDGDLASNQHGWQWTAGTGTDASPYYRVFNPVLQGKKFDPDGEYVRRYVPELRDMSTRFIHEPWSAPPTTGALFDVDTAEGPASYPVPIVDHATERVDALARLAEIRSADGP